MVEHDFRYSLMNPQHTLTECRALVPGRYQVTGNGGSIRNNDVLVVTLKGARDLSMRLTVEKVRHLINPIGQWVAVARGPVFGELAILNVCERTISRMSFFTDHPRSTKFAAR